MTNGTPPWELGVGRWEAGIYSSIEILKTGHFRAAQASPPRPPFLCPVAHASHGNSRTCCTSLVLQVLLRARPMHCVSESLGTQQQAFPHCGRLPAQWRRLCTAQACSHCYLSDQQVQVVLQNIEVILRTRLLCGTFLGLLVI